MSGLPNIIISTPKVYKKVVILLFSFLIIFLLVVNQNSPIYAYYTNMPASVVIGQPDFTSGSANQGGSPGPNTVSSPEDIVVCDGKLIISDKSNNRVLIFNSIPTTNNASADVVIGQADFSGGSANPGGRQANTFNGPGLLLCADKKLLVLDINNNRVLVFNSVPTSNNASADVVIGQPDFTSGSPNQGGSCKANTLRTGTNSPGLAYDGQRLYVSDLLNNRVLIFNSIPTANNASADLVLGQDNFTSCAPNKGGGRNAGTLDRPAAVSFAENKLFVVDQSNNRVLIWNSKPTSNGQPADIVIGQTDFSSLVNGFSASKFGGTVWDFHVSRSKLFVSDLVGTRVMVFDSIPKVNGASADIVIGQPNMITKEAVFWNPSPATQRNLIPGGVFEYGNRLFVADFKRNRILIFGGDYSSIPNFSIHYPPESSGEKVRLEGNVVMGEYGRFDFQNPEVSINNQGFGPLTNLSKRKLTDGETIGEFYHDFEPWAGISPRDQWTEGDGFSAHFKVTSYQSQIETKEAFLFWPFTLLSATTQSSHPEFTFQLPSKNLEYIKNKLDHFEIHVDNSKYLTLPTDLIDSDGKVVVSASTQGVSTSHITALPGEHEVKVKAFDKWGYSFDSNSITLAFTQALVSVGTTHTFSSFWFPLQVNKATGTNIGIISSFNPGSIKPNYNATTLTPTFTGIAFSQSTITMTVTNNQNPEESKTFTTTTTPDSTWSLTPTLYQDSTIFLSTEKDGLSTFIIPFVVKVVTQTGM